MKDLIKTVFTFIIIFALVNVYALDKEKNKTTPVTVTTKYLEGQTITGLTVDGAANVNIIKSSKTYVSIEVNEYLSKDISVKKGSDGMVIIKWSDGTRIKNNDNTIFNVTVYTDKLNKIESYGACDINSDDLFDSDYFEIKLNGASEIKNLKLNISNDFNAELNGASEIKNLILTVAGNSVLDLGGASDAKINMTCNNLTTVLNGASELKINFLKINNLDLDIHGASDFVAKSDNAYTGKSLNLKVAGASEADLSQIQFTNGMFNISGASEGKIWMNITPTSGSISGSSQLKYKGFEISNNILISENSEIKKIN